MSIPAGPFCPVAWLVIEPDHPALAGHFPDQPVLPGIVLLDHVIELFRRELDAHAAVASISAAKFLRPVLPGETVLIGVETLAHGQLRFICRVEGATAAQGTCRLASREPA